MMQSEITETENSIKELERTWNHLQVMYKQSTTKELLILHIMSTQTLNMVVEFE